MDNEAVLKVFRMVAVEFKGVSNEEVGEWIELTAPLVSKRRFRKLWAQALALLTAHRMKVSAVGSEPGSDPLADVSNISIGGLTRVSNYSEGEVSIGFNSNVTQFADLNAELSLTPYGIQYLSLLRMVVISITSAGESNGWA